MKPLAIFYGTTTGNTEEAAKDIAAALKRSVSYPIELIEVARIAPTRLQEYDRFLIGCPTWDVGELQSDWDRIQRKLGDLRFDGATIALFGSGDSVGYPDTFQDALGILGNDFRKRGATVVGLWPTEGYDFTDSLGVEGDNFLGLALDYDNDHRTCKSQINAWVEQIIDEFDLTSYRIAAEVV
jgi:flavodoxin I